MPSPRLLKHSTGKGGGGEFMGGQDRETGEVEGLIGIFDKCT
jgi:hypothetical protein